MKINQIAITKWKRRLNKNMELPYVVMNSDNRLKRFKTIEEAVECSINLPESNCMFGRGVAKVIVPKMISKSKVFYWIDEITEERVGRCSYIMEGLSWYQGNNYPIYKSPGWTYDFETGIGWPNFRKMRNALRNKKESGIGIGWHKELNYFQYVKPLGVKVS